MTPYRSLERLKALRSPVDLGTILNTLLCLFPPETQITLYRLDREAERLIRMNGAGKGWERSESHYPMEGTLPGLAVKDRAPIHLREGGRERPPHLMDHGMKGFEDNLYIPILEEGDVEGLLIVRSMERGITAPEGTIKMVSSLVGAFLSLTDRFCMYRKSLIELILLEEVTRNLIRYTTDLDRLLFVILTAVTAGDGLGFNRATFFTFNERMERLEGVAGIGPSSPEEAQRVWKETEGQGLRRLISATERGGFKEEGFNRYVRSLKFDLKEGSLLREVVERKIPYKVERGECPYHCDEIIRSLGTDSFAVLPITGLNRVLGVLIVDNLYTKKPILEEDIDTLMAICRQAGLAMENALLYIRLKEANRKITEAQARLLHNEKMVALGEMAAALAHSIRNPLVSIGGFVRRIRKGVSPETFEAYLQRVEKEVRRLERMLDDILTFSQKKEFTFEECRVDEIVEEALSIMEEELRETGIEVVQDMDPAIPAIRGEKGQLLQALLNILWNARQAMPEGGTLTIRAYPDEEGINIEVEDTGGGIPPEIVGNIFNPFFTTKKNGTGLGLPIAHTIIKNHGGEIGVKNMPGKGAIFVIRLPLPARDKASTPRASSQ